MDNQDEKSFKEHQMYSTFEKVKTYDYTVEHDRTPYLDGGVTFYRKKIGNDTKRIL